MTSPARVTVQGLPCSTCTIDELVAWVVDRLADPDRGTTATIACVNAHICNLAAADADLRALLEDADVLALDGMSVVWAARRAGATVERCNMTESFRAFLDRPGLPAARTMLIGLDQSSITRAAAELERRRTPLEVVRAMDGYADEASYRSAVEEVRPDLVLVGCGTPRSEQVVHAVAATHVPAVAWHVGGGTLEFLAGTSREAPGWMRRSGLQWVHRLALDPARMWRRYVLGNPAFVARTLREGRRARRWQR